MSAALTDLGIAQARAGLASGATPSVSTSPSCSTQPRMLESSPASPSSWSSATRTRARKAILRTSVLSSDMTAGLRPVGATKRKTAGNAPAARRGK